ncbi:hypothetical protein BJV74DRAFT_836714 [Russula compacta]|nr:hypothetical protein BJV74DRAFT_836714 [Russula compacta]
MEIWTSFRASTPGWLVSKPLKVQEDYSLSHYNTSEATGRINAASVHESAARKLASKGERVCALSEE